MKQRRDRTATGTGLPRMARAAELTDRASVCLDAGLPRDAARLLKEALAHEPALLEARLLDARVRLASARPTTAADEDADAALARCTRLWESGQRELARSSLPLRPAASMQVLRRQAALDVLLGRRQSAQAVLRAWLDQQPDAQSVRRLLARCVAVEHPREGVELMLGSRPGAMPAHLRCWAARVLASAGLAADAERLIVELLEECPHDGSLWHLAGRLARRSGTDAVAVHRLEMAVRRGRVAAAARSLMIAHLRAGRFIAAGAWAWRRVRRLRSAAGPAMSPKLAEAWSALALSARMSGRRRLARRAGRQVITLVGRAECRALRRKLWPHAVAGLVIASALSEKTAAESPDGPSGLSSLLRFACGRLEEHARAWPNRADAFHHLAACRQALGEVEAASDANRAALSLNPRYGDAIALRSRLRSRGPHPSPSR